MLWGGHTHKRKQFPPALSKQQGVCFALHLQSYALPFVCLIMQTQNESRVNSSTFRGSPAHVARKEMSACILRASVLARRRFVVQLLRRDLASDPGMAEFVRFISLLLMDGAV